MADEFFPTSKKGFFFLFFFSEIDIPRIFDSGSSSVIKVVKLSIYVQILGVVKVVIRRMDGIISQPRNSSKKEKKS